MAIENVGGNNTFSGAVSLVAGQTLAAGNVLVMYTYAGFASHATGRASGGFDYSGWSMATNTS